MNPMNLMQMFQNPQQFMQNIMGNNQIMSNPMVRNIMNMTQRGDIQGIEKFGRNIAKEKGIDFDKAFAEFKNQFPIK